MSKTNKMSNMADKAKGKVKEWTGDATGNESMQSEGAADQAKAKAKQAGENVKDAGRDAMGAMDEAANRQQRR
jgi:uncharacterized protein YjbJ (UPF0337 family)